MSGREGANVEACGSGPSQGILDALVRMAIVSADTSVRFSPLAGGVSSDIYRVELPSRVICVKRALARLKVAADWQAPVERSRYEVEWMRVAGAVIPYAVPALLGADAETGAFAMEYLDPEMHPTWKDRLLAGVVDAALAAAVGEALGRIHAATADRPDVADRFPTDDIFHAIRLEPYLLATARVHPDLAPGLHAIFDITRTTKRVLVHGDFSPKNLLVGPRGPVILDAECAWYGDPAFDTAFVLNHLLLKGARRPEWRRRYATAFDALVSAYFAHVRWEPPADVAARTAALLPALMLARVDGKSPVEYLTDSGTKDDVRAFARALIATPETDPRTILHRWVGRGSP
jgi:aminoglycoside phosphotransferase (APT) family kinase protein